MSTNLLEDSKIITHEMSEEMKTSYIDYAMSVIVGRALPDVRDGLKPVTQKNSLRPERFGNYAGQAAQEVRPYRR